MTIKLYDTDAANLLIEKEYSYKQTDITELVTELDNLVGNGFYREIYFENVHIGYGNALLSNKVALHFESDLEAVEMHFLLKGKSRAVTAQFKKEVVFEGGHHNIIYADQLEGLMEWNSDEIKLLEINLDPNFFKRFLSQDDALLEAFKNVITKQNCGLISPEHNRISPKMYLLIEEILNCNRKGVFKRIFLEAKITELLLLQLEQFCDSNYINTSVSKTEIEKLQLVRDFILTNIDCSYSLLDLAHLAGTNDFTLKKGFKELFGTTVFGFWNDAKMEQASKMLFEENKTITEVSDAIGYKNPRNFSAAFKRKYGISPKEMRK